MNARYLMAAVAGMVLMVGCGKNESAILEAGTGDLSVNVAQALSQVTLGNIERVEIDLAATPTPSDMLDGTYVLGFNGAEWTSTFEGVQAGCYLIHARGYVVGETEPVFVSDGVEACVTASNETIVKIVLNQRRLQEGENAPVIDWITTDRSTVRPGQPVVIGVGFSDDDPVVTLKGTSDDGGGSFSADVPVTLDGGRGTAEITWTAPTEQSDLPEEIEVELTDGKAHVRVQLFFRVIWPGKDVTAHFKLNLAPVVTSLRVDPANPVDGHPLVQISFEATDSDPCRGDGCLAPKFRWEIPAGCDYFEDWKWQHVWGPLWLYVPYISSDFHVIEGTFAVGAGALGSDNVYLQFPVQPNASCELKLTVTDGDGAKTESLVTVKPFDLVTHYTPSIEIDYQHGFVAEPGYELQFGVIANLRVPVLDFYVGNPKVYWNVGDQGWVEDTSAETEKSGLFWATRSDKTWTVGNNGVQCVEDGGASFVEVKAKACNPFIPEAVPGEELCDTLTLQVSVPNPEAVCAVEP